MVYHPNDEKTALEFARAIKEAFAVDLTANAKAEASNVRGNAEKFNANKAIDSNKDTYWVSDDSVKTASLTIDYGTPTTFNRFMA